MKILKTFLFTISFCFIFGSIMSLCGYCQAIPELVPDSNGFEVIEGSNLSSYNWSPTMYEMFLMQNPFFIDNMYDSADTWLKNNTGYDIEHSYQMGIDGTVFTDGGSLDVATANFLANKFSQGTLTASAIAANGWRVFSHTALQWGANAKEWFLGQYDSATNKITNIKNNVVHKITREGLNNYLGLTNYYLNNGDLINSSDTKLIFVSKGSFYTCSYYSGKAIVYQIKPLNVDGFLYTDGSDVHIIVPLGSPAPKFDVVQINEGTIKYSVSNADLNFSGTTYTNCVDYYISVPYNGMTIGVHSSSTIGNKNNIIIFYDYNTLPIGSVYDYSLINYSTLKSILDSLVGKYVDNNTLNSINDVISKAPIIYQTIDNDSVPVAEISPDLLDEIQDIVDNAVIANTEYEKLLSPYEESDPEPDPEPYPDNQGTEVPEDFPTTIFSPIDDSVGSVFDFVSIFEPLFYIFSFSAGLLGLWFVVPFVILFLILFRLLK